MNWTELFESNEGTMCGQKKKNCQNGKMSEPGAKERK